MRESDKAIFDILRERGDINVVERRITHWILPNVSEEIPLELVKIVKSLGYRIYEPASDSLEFERDDKIDPDAIMAEISKLEVLAEEHGCTYDGWETEIIEPNA